MKNGVLVHIRNDERPLSLPESIEGLTTLCAGGLNGREKDQLISAVKMRHSYESYCYKQRSNELYDLYLVLDDDEDDDRDWDEAREEWGEEWEAAREARDQAREEWERVAGEWCDLINGAHYPKGRGVTLIVDLPYPEEGLGEDGKWKDRKAGREWRRAAKRKVREAKEAAREGRPLPKYALEVPLALNRAVRTKEAYFKYTETSALSETLVRLEGWTCVGRAKARLKGAIEQELGARE